MLRFFTLVAATVALSSSAPNPGANPDTNFFRSDITPEEAQSYLNSPPFTEPQLAGRTAVLPLVRWNDPSFRAASAGPTLGHYWKNGHEIENTQDYDEEVYNAKQFHGQDGLGAFKYGYETPESSKVENRERSGDVQGSYIYKAGSNPNDIIKVRYWADSEGFHQEDNLPKVVLKPQEEAEDVRQARLAHEKAWQEAAAAAAQQPDPQGEYSEKYDYESSASEPQNSIASAPQPNRAGKAYSAQQQNNRPSQQGQYGQYGQQGQYNPQQGQYQGHFNQQQGSHQQPQGQYNQQSSGQYQYDSHSGASGQYQGFSNSPNSKPYQAQRDQDPEPTGPPRGFFYSFDYPVSIIVPKNGGQSGPTNPGQHIDHDTVGVYSKAQAQYHQ